MVTDSVCEYLVEKQKDKGDVAKRAAIIVGAAILLALLALLIFFKPAFIGLAMILMIGVVFFASRLLQSLNIEFEYCFVNGDLTVDKIINKSDRKRLLSVDVKKVEKTGRYKADEFRGSVLNYSGEETPENAIFMEAKDEAGDSYTFVITCPDEMILKMKPYFNQLVFREGFKDLRAVNKEQK